MEKRKVYNCELHTFASLVDSYCPFCANVEKDKQLAERKAEITALRAKLEAAEKAAGRARELWCPESVVQQVYYQEFLEALKEVTDERT